MPNDSGYKIYKVKSSFQNRIFVFTELMEEFEMDSFVVGNSDVEYESSLDELDLVDEFGSEEDKEQRKKRVKKRASTETSSSNYFQCKRRRC